MEAEGQSVVASPALKSQAGAIILTLLWGRELLMLLIREEGVDILADSVASQTSLHSLLLCVNEQQVL